MRRVTWPSWKQVRATTVVVIVAVFAFAAYFAVVDEIVAQRDQQAVQRRSPSRRKTTMADDEIISTQETDERPRGCERCEPRKPGGAAAEPVELGRRRRTALRRAPAAPRLPTSKNWYIIHTYSGFEQKVADSLRSARAGVRLRRQDRPDPDPHRRSGGAARRQEGHQQAAALSRLRAGADGDERPALARGEEHAARHRIRRRRQQPGAADGRRSEFDSVTGSRPRPSARARR